LQTIEIVPSASALMQSLRGFGYSAETALADLIDNSITAGANNVSVELDWNHGDPVMTMLDDGRGLDEETLIAAMRFGCEGPSVERAEGDLGRFGLGLKTASLSQCRRMTVATLRSGRTAALTWDLDEVVSRGRWEALVSNEVFSAPLTDGLRALGNGTLVVWQKFDKIGSLSDLDKETFFVRVQDVRAHLGMVFHRFLGGDAERVSIKINGRRVQPWDPFLRSHPSTITMQSERLRHEGAALDVTPYVLPHHDRFENAAEHEAAGGPGGWSERQGFYVYRGRRLVVSGGWLGLGGTNAWTREESSRLARIAIDLPLGMDAAWRIDVRKSLARPPGNLRSRLTALASACRTRAREVFAWRGGRARTQPVGGDREALWLSENRHGRLRYRVNRDHPMVQAFAEEAARKELLDSLLTMIERSVPVERIWLDVSESEGAGVERLDSSESANLASHIAKLLTEFPGEGSIRERLDKMLRQLPVEAASLRAEVIHLIEREA
jgi:hypothetical protein